MNEKVKKGLLIGGISLAVVITVFVSVLAGMGVLPLNKTKDDDTEGDEEVITTEQLAPVDKATGKINVLLLGVDVEGLRTDTIIVASYDLDNDKVDMLSIPRDTRMYVGSRYQKINAAHAIHQKGTIKGPQGSIEAVTRLTSIPINYYVEFSFSAFRDFIDALGGLEFDVPRDMNYEDPVQNLKIHLKKGQQHLDGDKAEQLVRFRSYPEGDIARVRMQQQFIAALAEQKLNAAIIKKIPDLFEAFNDNIKTNFTLVDVMRYLPNLDDLKTENITMHQVPGNYNDKDYGASYWICDMTKLKTIVNENFGYPANKATIHSADGSSRYKDTVIRKSTPAPASSHTAEATHKPTASSTPSASGSPSPSGSPTASGSPSPSHKPTASGSPSPSETPTGGRPAANTPVPDDDDDKVTDKPSKTSAPDDVSAPTKSPEKTSAPDKTSAPEKTAAPAKAPEKAPEKTAAPTKAPEKEPEKPSRPTANPVKTDE